MAKLFVRIGGSIIALSAIVSARRVDLCSGGRALEIRLIDGQKLVFDGREVDSLRFWNSLGILAFSDLDFGMEIAQEEHGNA